MAEFVVLAGDCRDHLAGLSDNIFDAIVTDPPYELVGRDGKGFNSTTWDCTGVAFSVLMWKECLRVLKPGGFLLSFGATRTFHRLACAIEDAGFEIRDTIHWTYAQGMPKSQNVALMLDKYAKVQGDRGKRIMIGGGGGKAEPVERYEPKTDLAKQFDGWGTALRPSHELICVARKECEGGNVHHWNKDGSDYGGVALNLVKHGVGGLRIDDSRHDGRWPTNTVLGCECEDAHEEGCLVKVMDGEGGAGVFPTFKFHKKPAGKERTGHLTQKPVDLMRWLIKLVVSPGSTILDPFTGSGTTGVAAVREGCSFVGMEIDPAFVEVARGRMATEGASDVGQSD